MHTHRLGMRSCPVAGSQPGGVPSSWKILPYATDVKLQHGGRRPVMGEGEVTGHGDLGVASRLPGASLVERRVAGRFSLVPLI
ncbi:hypothetical protein Dimus_019719 [Dionaea muscipula]